MISVYIEPSPMSNILNVIENTVGKDTRYTDIILGSLSSFVRTPTVEWGYSLELRAISKCDSYYTLTFNISEHTKDLLALVLSTSDEERGWGTRVCPIDEFLEEMRDLVMMESL